MEENVLNGCFVKGSKIINNETSNQLYWIRLNEIKKIIKDNDESCIFWTYKDCRYFVCLPEDYLLFLVNLSIFNPEKLETILIQE